MRIGTVAGPVGVRGEVKVDLATDFPDRFKRLRTIYLGEEHRPAELSAARRHGDRVALLFAGVTDRDAATLLKGLALYIPRADAVPLPDGHYYHDQILGLRAVTTSGEELGTVTDILATGSNDVYVVTGGRQEVLIPALHDIVLRIDLASGTMLIEPVEGLY